MFEINIKSIEVKQEVTLEKLSLLEKGGRLDLLAKLDNGTMVNIEMQVRNNGDIKKRSTLYASKLITQETKVGVKYDDMKKVIMVNILDYNILPFEDYISKTKIVLDSHRDYETIDGIQWYFIELPKFRKANPDMRKKIDQGKT